MQLSLFNLHIVSVTKCNLVPVAKCKIGPLLMVSPVPSPLNEKEGTFIGAQSDIIHSLYCIRQFA